MIALAAAALCLNPGHPSRRGLISVAARAALGRRPWPASNGLASGRRLAPETAEAGDPQRHLAFGHHYWRQKELTRAYACFRTAGALAALKGQRHHEVRPAALALPPDFQLLQTQQRLTAEQAIHDPYGRLRRLASLAQQLAGRADFWLLDVGGGDGFLSALLPQAHYVLCEPTINGLSALPLPLPAAAFDVVVASHVLEHIPAEQRQQFLDELLRVGRGHLLLLNPFGPPTGQTPAETAIFRATGAEWADEHLRYGLPDLDQLGALLDARHVAFRVTPFSDARVMYWQYLALHYAELAGEGQAAAEATDFFQQQFDYRPVAGAAPHDFLIEVQLA